MGGVVAWWVEVELRVATSGFLHVCVDALPMSPYGPVHTMAPFLPLDVAHFHYCQNAYIFDSAST